MRISSTSAAKLSKGENVNTDILIKYASLWIAAHPILWRIALNEQEDD
jgi:hypothetical protein